MLLIEVIAFALLIFLPGAWLTFGLPLADLPFGNRLFIGVMLAPFVAAIQFFLMRLMGIPFEHTTTLLILVNLPAIYLILKWRTKFSLPVGQARWAAALVSLVILASIAPFLLNPQERQYSWEAWSQTDVVYSFANGNLIPEEPELAGVRLSYPWVGHIYQAALSYSLGTPPVTNYIWANLVWLLGIFVLAAAIVTELGGNQLSQVTVAIWLSFGVNFVGYYVGGMIPAAWVKAHPFWGGIWGDNRYTPWLDKILFFGQMYFAMGIFIAIVYLMIRPWPAREVRKSYLILTTMLLAGLGLIYAVLLPPALVIVGLKAIVVLFERRRGPWQILFKEFLAFGITIAIPAALTFVYIRFITLDRAGGSLLSLHDFRFMAQRTIESVVVTSPLLIGLGMVIRRCWEEKPAALMILGLGALASCVLYILFDIPWYRNEYKFIFTAAICLAPFASLAMEALLDRVGRAAVPLLAVLTAILASPLAYHVYMNAYTMYTRTGPLVDVRQFDLRLDDREPLSGLVDTIRLETPANSVLLLDSAEINFPTPTRRQLYIAPPQKEPYPGVLGLSDDTLRLVRGYSTKVLADRRSTVRKLFDSENADQMGQAFDHLLILNRPLVFILDEKRQATLLSWLSGKGRGTRLYEGNGMVLWLIDSSKND